MDVLPVSTAGGVRRYALAAPAGAVRAAALFLPGTGGTADWAAHDTGLPAAFAGRGIATIVPDGLPPDPTRPPKFLTNPPRWNDGGTRPGAALYSGADDVAFLAAVVADLAARGLCPGGRVGVVGFSNGAGMAYRFAAERSDLVSAAVPVAGHCWTDAVPARPVPTLVIVGTADPLVPLAGGPTRLPWGGPPVERPAVGASLARWARANGCSADPVVVADAGGVREVVYPGPAEVRAVFLAGHGHHWPGGRGLLGEKLGGPNRAGFDANARAADFVLAAPTLARS